MELAQPVLDQRHEMCPYGHGDYCRGEVPAGRLHMVPEAVVCIECWERKAASLYALSGDRNRDYIL